MIDRNDASHVAKLARLKLSPEELERFSAQLESILDYINQLNELDTSTVEPLSHALDLRNVFRDDAVTGSIPREQVLANAPEQRDGFFLVPPVLEWEPPEE